MRKIVVLVLALTMIFAMSSVVFADEAPAPEKVYTLKWGTVSPEVVPTSQVMKTVAAEIEERTNGGIKFELYFSSTLGSSNELADGLLNGAIEMANINAGTMASFGCAKAGILNLPFFFKNSDHVMDTIEQYGDQLLEGAEDVIGIPMGIWHMGWRSIMNSKKSIETMDDFSGLLIRVQNGSVYYDAFQALGMSPVNMAVGEVYTSISQGTLDGQESPIVQLFVDKNDEIMDYLILTNHVCGTTVPVLSNITAAMLPEEYLQIMQEVFAEHARDSADLHESADEEQIQTMVERNGITVVDPSDEFKTQMIEAVAPVLEKYEEELGTELCQAIQDLAK